MVKGAPRHRKGANICLVITTDSTQWGDGRVPDQTWDALKIPRSESAHSII